MYHTRIAYPQSGTDLLRLRVSDLRLIYVIDTTETLIVVLKVARRSESTYRRVTP